MVIDGKFQWPKMNLKRPWMEGHMSPPEYRQRTSMYCPSIPGDVLICGPRSDHNTCKTRAKLAIQVLWRKIELEKRTSS